MSASELLLRAVGELNQLMTINKIISLTYYKIGIISKFSRQCFFYPKFKILGSLYFSKWKIGEHPLANQGTSNTPVFQTISKQGVPIH